MHNLARGALGEPSRIGKLAKIIRDGQSNARRYISARPGALNENRSFGLDISRRLRSGQQLHPDLVSGAPRDSRPSIEFVGELQHELLRQTVGIAHLEARPTLRQIQQNARNSRAITNFDLNNQIDIASREFPILGFHE